MDENSNNSLAQDKVLILYILNNIKYDITESNLFKLISPINNINYFYFKQLTLKMNKMRETKIIKHYIKSHQMVKIL